MKIDLYDIANDPKLLKYIQENIFDPWEGTPFEGYRALDNKQKGNYGEMFVEKMFLLMNSTVYPALGNNAGHDRIVDDIRTEIKFSIAQTDHKKRKIKPNVFTMNHVSLEKDWKILVFVGINPRTHESYAKFMIKEDFVNLYNHDKDTFFEYFGRQQGGKKSVNDDYISSGKKLIKLLNSPYMRDIEKWHS